MGLADRSREEDLNAFTHAAGALLGIAGLVGLVVRAARFGDAWHVTSVAVFGASLVLLYTTSTLYHLGRDERTKARLRRWDHAAIFLLIAGTYTPFVLVTLRGPWGWSLFGVVWSLAVAGVLLKLRFAGRFRVFSTMVYLTMGWLVLVALKPLLAALPPAGVGWLVAGGIGYTAGSAFYLWRQLPFHHALWHLFVLAGSACHWVAIYAYVLPAGR